MADLFNAAERNILIQEHDFDPIGLQEGDVTREQVFKFLQNRKAKAAAPVEAPVAEQPGGFSDSLNSVGIATNEMLFDTGSGLTDILGADALSESLARIKSENVAQLRSNLSADALKQMDTPLFKDDPMSLFGITTHPDITAKGFLDKTLAIAPSMVGVGGTGLYLRSQALKIAKKLNIPINKTTDAIISGASVVPPSAALEVGMNQVEIRDSILAVDPEMLVGVPEFDKLVASGMSQNDAQAELASIIATPRAITSGVISSLFEAPFGVILGRIRSAKGLAKSDDGFFKRGAKGFAAEGGAEAGQEKSSIEGVNSALRAVGLPEISTQEQATRIAEAFTLGGVGGSAFAAVTPSAKDAGLPPPEFQGPHPFVGPQPFVGPNFQERQGPNFQERQGPDPFVGPQPFVGPDFQERQGPEDALRRSEADEFPLGSVAHGIGQGDLGISPDASQEVLRRSQQAATRQSVAGDGTPIGSESFPAELIETFRKLEQLDVLDDVVAKTVEVLPGVKALVEAARVAKVDPIRLISTESPSVLDTDFPQLDLADPQGQISQLVDRARREIASVVAGDGTALGRRIQQETVTQPRTEADAEAIARAGREFSIQGALEDPGQAVVSDPSGGFTSAPQPVAPDERFATGGEFEAALRARDSVAFENLLRDRVAIIGPDRATKEVEAAVAAVEANPGAKPKFKPKGKFKGKAKAKPVSQPKATPKPTSKPVEELIAKTKADPGALSQAAKAVQDLIKKAEGGTSQSPDGIAKVKPKAKAKAKPKAKAKAKANPKATPKPASKAVAELIAKTKAKAKPKVEAKPIAKAKPTSKPVEELIAKTKAKPKAKAKPRLTRPKGVTIERDSPGHGSSYTVKKDGEHLGRFPNIKKARDFVRGMVAEDAIKAKSKVKAKPASKAVAELVAKTKAKPKTAPKAEPKAAPKDKPAPAIKPAKKPATKGPSIEERDGGFAIVENGRPIQFFKTNKEAEARLAQLTGKAKPASKPVEELIAKTKAKPKATPKAKPKTKPSLSAKSLLEDAPPEAKAKVKAEQEAAEAVDDFEAKVEETIKKSQQSVFEKAIAGMKAKKKATAKVKAKPKPKVQKRTAGKATVETEETIETFPSEAVAKKRVNKVRGETTKEDADAPDVVKQKLNLEYTLPAKWAKGMIGAESNYLHEWPSDLVKAAYHTKHFESYQKGKRDINGIVKGLMDDITESTGLSEDQVIHMADEAQEFVAKLKKVPKKIHIKHNIINGSGKPADLGKREIQDGITPSESGMLKEVKNKKYGDGCP